jgi:hypothetical protein
MLIGGYAVNYHGYNRNTDWRILNFSQDDQKIYGMLRVLMNWEIKKIKSKPEPVLLLKVSSVQECDATEAQSVFQQPGT